MGVEWGWCLLSGLYPLYRAWRVTAGSTLAHAVIWAWGAWGTWCAAAFVGDSPTLRYLALCLTACAGVAVLGARRPGVGAWNFVVLGLLVVMCRPFLEGLGRLRLEGGHVLIPGLALAVGVGNYAPTRYGIAVLVLGAWCGMELSALAGREVLTGSGWTLMLVLVPWLAWGMSRTRTSDDPSEIWREFRDRFGMVWGQRVREQFNRAAESAGLPVELRWSGLVALGEGENPEATRKLLLAVLKRFSTG